jgi:hypothetical protein
MQVAYLCRKKNMTDRQTDMNGPIRCSSLMLQHEEHLKSDMKEGRQQMYDFVKVCDNG